jgi:hypothetical protein
MTLYKPQKKSLLINFATDKGAVAIRLNDPSQVLERYRAFFGGDIVYCANKCGTEIVKTTTKKYCDECAKEIIRIRDTERKRKTRNFVHKLP